VVRKQANSIIHLLLRDASANENHILFPESSPERYQSSLMYEIAHVSLEHPMIGFHQRRLANARAAL